MCLKDKKLHFVIVRAVQYPQNPVDYDGVFMEKVRTHAQKFEARAYYGVGLAHGKDYGLPLTKKPQSHKLSRTTRNYFAWLKK